MPYIVEYWNTLKNSVNTEDPIYKWQCFDSGANIKKYINQIADVLKTFDYSDELSVYKSMERNAFSCLFLVRCALLCKIGNDWDLERNDLFFEGIGQYNFDRNSDWSRCITTAERVLRRSPLMRYKVDPYNERTAKKYCARVLVEAGLPLNSFHGNNGKFSKVEEGLKNIYDLYSSTSSELAYERTIRQFMASGNLFDSTGQSFWLPGGYAGCRNFFSIGLELLESIDGDDTNQIKRSLSERGFENPTNESVNYIFGLHNYKQNRKAIDIRRCLYWEDDIYETHVFVECMPAASLSEVRRLELNIANQAVDFWTYAGNGTINGERKSNKYYENVFSSAILKKDSEQIEALGHVDFTNPVFFKNKFGNIYEWATTSSFKQADFPLCVIFPDGYIEDHALNLTNIESSILSSENDTAGYQVYKFIDEDQLNRAGLSIANSQLVLNPPEKFFTVNFFNANGRKYRNPTLTTEYPRAPLRSLNSIVLSSEDRETWDEKPAFFGDESFHFAYYKLDSAAKTDPGCGILILPRDFDYTFITDQESGCFKGIQFQYKSDGEIKNIENVDVFIDNQEATESDWMSLEHNSIIRCIIKNEQGEKLDLIIPSPIIGASWFFTSNEGSDSSLNKGVSAVNYKAAVKLNCVQQSIGGFDVLYKIKLVDNGQVLLEFTDCLVPQLNGNNTYFLDLPAYLGKLFSATNSLSAKMNIVAEVRPYDGVSTKTDELEITRFDESDYDGCFFCVGILNQEVLDREPTTDELQRELWMKVPAYQSSTGDMKWNHRNRIRLINNFITETSSLNDFQKLLLGNDFVQVQNQIRNYFDIHCYDLGNDVIQLIEKCFDLCVKYDVPICNLWVLQATIQDDRIFVQIPNIYKFKHLLNENTVLCSFDWQLIRPSALDFAKDSNVIKLIKKQIEDENEDNDGLVDAVNTLDDIDADYILSGIPEPPFVDEDDELISWNSDAFKAQLANDKINCSTNLSDYELLLYFIVRQVVYGKNEYYQKRLGWATLCLKYLKCINASKTKKIVKTIRKEIKNIYKVNQHQTGFTNIVWEKWKAGKFEDDVPCDKISNNDPYKQGQNDAINSFLKRYWLELLKKFTCISDSERFYFNMYRFPYPADLNRGALEGKARKLEAAYNQYKVYFEQGWKKLDDADAIQYCCYLSYLDNVDAAEIPCKAAVIGFIAHSWFIEWSKIVDSFKIGDKLKTNIKKLIPIRLLDLAKDEEDLEKLKADSLRSLSERIMDMLESAELEEDYQSLLKVAMPLLKSRDKEMRKIGAGICAIIADEFGDYKANYYLYCCNAFSPNLRAANSNAFLDQNYFFAHAQKRAQGSKDFDEIRILFEEAASLGNKKALLKLAEWCDSYAEESREAFNKEYANLCRYHSPKEIDIAGRLKDYFLATIKFEKRTIHYYKIAARLGDKDACNKYYEKISELKGDGKVLPMLKKVLRMMKDFLEKEMANDASYIKLVENVITDLKNDIRRTERDKYIFDKWCNLDNEWVYLRKAFLKGCSMSNTHWYGERKLREKKVRDPRDGKEYNAVKLGNTWWLAEDLQYEPVSDNNFDGKCYYTNETAHKAAFDGWRLPTIEDFKELGEWSEKHGIRKDPAGVSLKSEEWKSDRNAEEILSGTDDFGFSATPSGLMIVNYDRVLRNDEAFYWTSSENNEKLAYCANISSSHNEMGVTTMSKDYCLAVRLVCDLD